MPGITGMTAIMKNFGHTVEKLQATFDFPQQEHAGVGGDFAAVEVDFELFPADVFKKKPFGGMMNFVQSCFLLRLVKTYCKSMRYEGKQLFL
jgi:hypothetical protein